jgi:S1-C subfamily serine protease
MKVFLMVLVLSSMACGAEASWRDAVVKVTVQGIGDGTGFVVADGLIMTAAHIVTINEKAPVYIKHRWANERAMVVYVDKKFDVALLMVRGKTAKPLVFCSLKGVKDHGIATGVSGVFEFKKGVVLGFGQGHFSTNILTLPGDSGSPVIQGEGRARCVSGMTVQSSIIRDRGVHVDSDVLAWTIMHFLMQTQKSEPPK